MHTGFADRLNRLFDTVFPPGRGPHTSAELVTAMRAAGVPISAPYLSQLRSGQRAHPSRTTLDVLAAFFGVDPAYFTDEEYFTALDRELHMLFWMRDEEVRRLVARVAGLSEAAQREWLRRDEGPTVVDSGA